MAHRGQDSSTEAPDKQCTFPSKFDRQWDPRATDSGLSHNHPFPAASYSFLELGHLAIGRYLGMAPAAIRLCTNATQGSRRSAKA